MCNGNEPAPVNVLDRRREYAAGIVTQYDDAQVRFADLTSRYIAGELEFSEYRDAVNELVSFVGQNRFHMHEPCEAKE